MGGKTFHVGGKSFYVGGKTFHMGGKTFYVSGKTFHVGEINILCGWKKIDSMFNLSPSQIPALSPIWP